MTKETPPKRHTGTVLTIYAVSLAAGTALVFQDGLPEPAVNAASFVVGVVAIVLTIRVFTLVFDTDAQQRAYDKNVEGPRAPLPARVAARALIAGFVMACAGAAWYFTAGVTALWYALERACAAGLPSTIKKDGDGSDDGADTPARKGE